MELRYGQIPVGTITGEVLSDDTWYGRFDGAVDPGSSPVHQRLHDFIAFSIEWHERLRSDLSAEATEFDRFGEVIFSGVWQTVASDGSVSLIADAPVSVQDEVTWRTIPPAQETFAGVEMHTPEFIFDHPSGLRISRDLLEADVASIDGVGRRDMGTGYVWYALPVGGGTPRRNLRN
jgi:hypothetical protein